MVTVLAYLIARFDDSSLDELFSFKKAMELPYLKDNEKTIYAKF